MTRGDVVKPTAEAIAASRFQEASRLRLKLRTIDSPFRCRSCGVKLKAGRLYAAGAEYSSNLCLGCVEPAEAVAAVIADRHSDAYDPPPRERPSPAEYLDPPAPFECEFCGATERDHPEDRCERCPA